MIGTDLSSHNTYDITANPAKFQFFILKASEGTSYPNPANSTDEAYIKRLMAQVQYLRKNKLTFGMYHFFHGDGATEAMHFLNMCKNVGYKFTPGDIVPMLDVETPGQGTETEVLKFREAVGHGCGFYSYVDYIEQMHYSTAMEVMPLWLANPSKLPTPRPWTTPVIVQAGEVDSCDLDTSTRGTLPLIQLRTHWEVLRDGKVIAKTHHPRLFVAGHPHLFTRAQYRVGFRKVIES